LRAFASARLKPVLVDEHGLLFQPLLPGFLGDVFPDALAECTRKGRIVEAVGSRPSFTHFTVLAMRRIIFA